MDLTINKFLRYIALEKRYSPNTIESYSTDLTQFEKYLDELSDGHDIYWRKIDKRYIRHFLMELQQQGLNKRSIARKVATLKSFFKFLEKEQTVDKSIASGIKMPRFDNKLPEYLSREEIEKIVNLPDLSNFEGVRDKAILEMFYSCGVRLSELLNLKLEDLMLREDAIRVIGKGKKERILPIGAPAKNSLLNYLDWRKKVVQHGIQEIFVLKSGKNMYPMAVQRLIKEYINKVVSISSASPHMLRHSYATHLLDSGANIRVVKDLLGHESLSTTQVYTHLSIDHLKNVYRKAHPGAKNK
jgi:integrase/recombinase XerC